MHVVSVLVTCKPQGLKSGAVLHGPQVGERIFNDGNKTFELEEIAATWGTSDVVPWSLQGLHFRSYAEQEYFKQKRGNYPKQKSSAGLYFKQRDGYIWGLLIESADLIFTKDEKWYKGVAVLWCLCKWSRSQSEGVDISMKLLQQTICAIINSEPFILLRFCLPSLQYPFLFSPFNHQPPQEWMHPGDQAQMKKRLGWIKRPFSDSRETEPKTTGKV